ncbi:MAG: alkaline phosphatase D family protein [Planctomycetaceae bacterium]|jgi:alkaline phosphatase D|nr:alkaline phosphatase D family protein [Planctomycetaceae bacterium]
MRLIILLTLAFAILNSTTFAEDCTATHISAGKPMASMGIMVGEVTPRSAYIQVRLSTTDKLVDRDLPGTPGVVEFTLTTKNKSNAAPSVQLVPATEAHDFISRAVFSKLKPGSQYICTTKIGPDAKNLQPGPMAEFKTLPGAKKSAAVKFVVVTGMNYAKFHGDDRIDKKQHLEENNTKLPQPYAGPDKHLGYPSLASILKQQPDFFVGTGDNVYYDTPDKPRAETIPELRQKWHEQFMQPRYKDLFAKVPTYWMIDDHDYRIDDGDNSGDYLPTPAQGREMMLEQLPVSAHDDDEALTYRTHRVTKDLQIWFPENRMYRSPNAMEDGPQKTIWGKKQKAWLKRTLAASDAKFKLLISPTPMVGPDDLRKFDNHTNINGFRHERGEFFSFLKEEGLLERNFYVVCGDRHWQYHAVHPSGVEEFSCGALVDANSRLGRSPGDPKSTDPKGLIKQPYSQDPRSGGFLMIDIAGGYEEPKLTFTWHDELGKVLHKTVKE